MLAIQFICTCYHDPLKIMSRTQLSINILLAAVCLFLLIDKFWPKSKQENITSNNAEVVVSDADSISTDLNMPLLYADSSTSEAFKNLLIAHVNTDTILEKVTYFKKLRTEFERKSDKAESELASRMRVFENDYIDVQKRVQAGQVNEEQLQVLQKQLMQQEMELSKFKEAQTMKLMDEERIFNKKITSTLQEFFKSYGERNNIKYILGYTSGSGILYAHNSFDITEDVLAQLNRQLANRK
jgi:outer membrane protein